MDLGFVTLFKLKGGATQAASSKWQASGKWFHRGQRIPCTVRILIICGILSFALGVLKFI